VNPLQPPLVIVPDREGGFLVFSRPLSIWDGPALAQAEALAREHGAWLAGGLRYAEAETEAPGWWGVFEQPVVMSPTELAAEADPSPVIIGPLLVESNRDAYGRSFAVVREELARGTTYQTNLTFAVTGRAVSAPAWSWRSALRLWLELTAAQGREAVFAVLDELATTVVASASPELFFARLGDEVETRPMKGTAPRDPDPARDAAHRHELATSVKNRAENLMVTDMLRNDLGRLAVPGGVSVPRLFEIEEYPTVWQMTSTVLAHLKPGISLAGLMAALFPCASITGAPKLSTQHLIARVEDSPRGWYTGTFGWYKPGSALSGPDRGRFSVLIRTLTLNGPEFRLGVGGGVVWDSTAEEEYAEAWAKTRFLDATRRSFSLTEALLWEPEGGFFLLDEHERRLAAACRDFGGTLDIKALRHALDAEVSRLRVVSPGPFKLRVLIDPSFAVRVEGEDVGTMPETLTVALATKPLRPETLLWRRYKTTIRGVYDALKVPGADQTIYYNERGELTESTSMNLVLETGGRFLTPALSSGLLDGTFRSRLIAEGRIEEAVLSIDSLKTADTIWLVNSVRRWKKAVLAGA
jgi:para-aminobenzoate synthetase/4-amino-4-deoxychorismate lyase